MQSARSRIAGQLNVNKTRDRRYPVRKMRMRMDPEEDPNNVPDDVPASGGHGPRPPVIG